MSIGWLKALSKMDWKGLSDFFNRLSDYPVWSVVFVFILITYFIKIHISAPELDEFFDEHIVGILLAFILSSVALLRQVVLWMCGFFVRRIEAYRIKNRRLSREKSIIRELDCLNRVEMEVLKWAISKGSRTIPSCGKDWFHAFVSLSQKGIMEGWAEGWGHSLLVPGTIVPFVWERLKEHEKFKHWKKT